jgi:hypothetical protein
LIIFVPGSGNDSSPEKKKTLQTISSINTKSNKIHNGIFGEIRFAAKPTPKCARAAVDFFA